MWLDMTSIPATVNQQDILPSQFTPFLL